jgi:Zn-finger nucleic acid-binding protein
MERYDVDVDYCPSCKGVWLDIGEIDKITKIQSTYDEEHYNKYHYMNVGKRGDPTTAAEDNKINRSDNVIAVERIKEKDPFVKRILIVDDDPDITFTFKVELDGYYYDKRRFKVYTYNNPLLALSEFKLHFYDLLLTDINMPASDSGSR